MDEIIQLANKAMNMLEVTELNNKDKTLITDVIHKIRKQAFSLNGVVKPLPTKEDALNKIGKRLFEDNNIKYEEILIKPKESGYMTGFLECYEWLTK